MATVNFSVPDEVKVAFDKAFSEQNKSAIVADLMRRAVRESVQRRRREQLFQQLCADRSRRPATSRNAPRIDRYRHMADGSARYRATGNKVFSASASRI